MKQYILVRGDEDGNPISWLGKILPDISTLMEDYGVERFYEDVPESTGPNYWPEGEALLLEVRVLRVKPKTVVETWEVE